MRVLLLPLLSAGWSATAMEASKCIQPPLNEFCRRNPWRDRHIQGFVQRDDGTPPPSSEFFKVTRGQPSLRLVSAARYNYGLATAGFGTHSIQFAHTSASAFGDKEVILLIIIGQGIFARPTSLS